MGRPPINDDYEDDAALDSDDYYTGAVDMSDAHGFSAGSVSTELREGSDPKSPEQD